MFKDTHLAIHALIIMVVCVCVEREREREREVTAARAWKVASLQQLSRRMTGFALSLKAQCIRVSLNLINTPSTLSCNRGWKREIDLVKQCKKWRKICPLSGEKNCLELLYTKHWCMHTCRCIEIELFLLQWMRKLSK
jgi:hypothetical protein